MLTDRLDKKKKTQFSKNVFDRLSWVGMGVAEKDRCNMGSQINNHDICIAFYKLFILSGLSYNIWKELCVKTRIDSQQLKKI